VLTATSTIPNERAAGHIGSVLDVPLEKIHAPVLLVHNKKDACEVSPYSGMQQVLDRLTGAPVKELITVESTQVKYTSGPGANPCFPFGPHGFLGIEDDVLGKISDWITKH